MCHDHTSLSCRHVSVVQQSYMGKYLFPQVACTAGMERLVGHQLNFSMSSDTSIVFAVGPYHGAVESNQQPRQSPVLFVGRGGGHGTLGQQPNKTQTHSWWWKFCSGITCPVGVLPSLLHSASAETPSTYVCIYI